MTNGISSHLLFIFSILMGVIPNLQTLMEGDEFNEEDEYDIEETTVSHQRWKYLLCRLINAISDQHHPLALHLDGKCTFSLNFFSMHQLYLSHKYFLLQRSIRFALVRRSHSW